MGEDERGLRRRVSGGSRHRHGLPINFRSSIELSERQRDQRSSRGRAVAAPLRVALLRVVRRPARLAVVATGIALATATLVGVLTGSLIVRDRALRKALDAVPPSQRSFRVDVFGLTFTLPESAGTSATAALRPLSPVQPVPAVTYRTLRLREHLVLLTAVDGLGRWVALRSGRLPRTCRPARCEVLVIGSRRLPEQLTASGLHVVPVGRAALTVPAVLGDFARPSQATLLVSSDVRGLSTLPALESIFQTRSWVVPIRPRDIRPWEVTALLDREARAQAQLLEADPDLRLTAPDQALLDAQRQGRIASRRLLLVGGEVAAILLGFVVLAAVGLRRTLLAEWRRLEERGARRSQLWLLLGAETGVAALAGVLVGTVLGIGIAAWASSRAGTGVHALLEHAVPTRELLVTVLVVWAAATLVLAASVRPPAGGRAGPVRIGDLVALAALGAAALAASRGGAGADALAANRTSVTLLLLFPALVSLAAALLAARALRPALRLAERAARRSRPAVRLALLALERAPARTAATAAFLVVSLGLALLASGYRATLERGVRDEAAYQVPLDYALTEGGPLVGPLDAASPARYRSIASGVRAYPVLRRYGDVPTVGTERASPVVLGLDPAALAGVHGWRADFGPRPPAQLAALLDSGGPVRLAGAPLPEGTTGLGLAVAHKGADVELLIAIAAPSGAIVEVPLTRVDEPGAGQRQRVPAHGRVVALEILLTRKAAAALAHREATHSIGQGAGPEGSLELGPLVAFSPHRRLGVVTSWKGWIGRSGARRVPGSRVRVRYALTEAQTALFRHRQPTDGHPLPLVVSPDVARGAAAGGLVTLEFGTEHVTGRIVAVSRRFPGTADGAGSFVLADESHLQTALDAEEPGTGRPIEVWLSVPSRNSRRTVDAALRRLPFAALAVASRRGIEHELRSDPLARGIEIALGIGALIALALSICGLWLVVLGDVADERGELYDLEAQGVTPGELRTQLRLRALILAAFGVAGGILLGLVLTTEVVHLVQVSASGDIPVPPLARDLGWAPAGLGLALVVLLGAGLVELTIRRSFREATARRSGEAQ